MGIQRISAAYFSPTGTTKSVTEQIAEKVYENAANKTAAKTTEKAFVKTVDNISKRVTEHVAERIVEKVSEQVTASLFQKTQSFDFTLPQMRQNAKRFSSDELVVFGMPVYAGRLPNVLLKYLETPEGNGAFAVPVDRKSTRLNSSH